MLGYWKLFVALNISNFDREAVIKGDLWDSPVNYYRTNVFFIFFPIHDDKRRNNES